MYDRKYICEDRNGAWSLDVNSGKIVCINIELKDNVFEFWLGNPPTDNPEHFKLFSRVCEFAVSLGLLTRFTTYHIA
jgi:hypothetical protein